MISPIRPNAVQSTNVTSSRSSPLAVLNFRLQASPNSVTAIWLGRYFICGSRVRLPNSKTRLKLAMDHLIILSPLGRGFHPCGPAAARGRRAGDRLVAAQGGPTDCALRAAGSAAARSAPPPPPSGDPPPAPA